MRDLYKSILKKIWITAAALVIVAAVCSSLFRALTPFAKQYKGQVEQHLSALIGQPVTIQTMETGWYWFQPVLKLDQVHIHDGSNQELRLESLLVGINIFKSLWEWQIQPGVLIIDDIDLVLRQKDDRWSIDGLSTTAMDNKDMTPARTQQILVWLAEQERLIIRHVSAHLHFSDGGLIPISGLNVSVHNQGGFYKLKGEARLDQTNVTSLELLGDVYFDPYNINKTKGQLFFSAKHLVPSQWQSLAPKMTERLLGGKGALALWLDIDKGMIASVQAQVKLKRFAWRLPNDKQSQMIQSFFANLSWKPQDASRQDNGWQLQADGVRLRIGGVLWPENKILVTYDKIQQSYSVFVKSIIIKSLLSETISWPPSMLAVLNLKPHGLLTDTQLMIKDQQLISVLTRFDKLGWDAHDAIPAVENLSGVLNWQEQEGHLELDSENTSVMVNGYPAQNFNILNGSIEWKELNDGLRVSIDRFLANQKELTLSLEGALDQVTADSLGHIRLNATYSGENAQKWMPYLPKKHIKPKLYTWLNKDIKSIGKASATLKINGFAKDFPFDNTPGEFTITAHASDAELFITPKWQLIKDIEAYIHLDKRNLGIDITHADAQGVPIDQMNLRIDDIGKDKETLLIHSLINGKAQKILNFLLASPVEKKLSMLKTMALKGLVAVNLRLEVALYPENDDVLVRGDLDFQHNSLVYKHQLGPLNVRDITGSLSFDEKGVKDSALIANVFGDPLQIKIQSKTIPEDYTSIQVTGTTSIDALKKRFNSPVLSYLKGMFYINALLKLTENPNDFDTMEVNSTLQGLAIDLPEPMNKPADAKLPVKLNVAFNPDKGTRMDVLLGKLNLFNQNFDSMSVKIKILPDNDWLFRLSQKNIAGELLYHPETKLLSGSLDRLHLHDFDLNKSTRTTSNVHPDDVPNLNVHIDDLTVGAKRIGNISLKTVSTAESLSIESCRIDTPAYQFAIQGEWTQKGKINHTRVDVSAHINDLAKSLELWDITPAVNAGKGDLEFRGNWDKSLFDFSLASVNGSMYIKLKKGIITHLSPETEEKLGLGKLLSILSLQTIPRRLQLDFSDLSHQGYSFDVFKGNFIFKHGIMSTRDSYLDGPVAYAGMKGDLDLVRRLYDLDLKISPHITASLPVVATIAGGPIAGLATWVATKIINQGMQRISAYSYKVSGPWNQPVVQQVSMVKQITEKEKGPVQFVDESEDEH